MLSFVDPSQQVRDPRFWDTARSLANYIAIMMKRWRTREEAEYRAFHDSLTGLPNRALFMERLRHCMQQAVRRPSRLTAVLFVDADHFKAVNDTLGHACGDAYLRELARRLSASVRDADTVARLGGDEYAVLLEDLSGPANAVHLARRILSSLESPLKLDDHELRMSVSIGIAVSGADQASAEQLLQNADLAMYRAKSAGGGSYEMYDIGMHAAALRRLKLEMELRQAQAEEQLGLLYEPVVDLGSGRMMALDAIVDWRSPGRGSIAPAEVVELARETGLDVDLDMWKLRHGIMRLAQWRADPELADVRIAVRVSPRSLAHTGFLESVRRTTGHHGLAPRAVVLQITDLTALMLAACSEESLKLLEALDIDCWFGDFGPDSLSLRSLQALPVSRLKVDVGALHAGDDAGESLALVRAVASLAEGLGLPWIAAGVQSDDQLEQVRALGCTAVQGPAVAAPVRASEVAAMSRRLVIGRELEREA